MRKIKGGERMVKLKVRENRMRRVKECVRQKREKMSMDRREWRRWKGGKENDEVESGRKIKEGERESVRQKGEIRFEWKGGERKDEGDKKGRQRMRMNRREWKRWKKEKESE